MDLFKKLNVLLTLIVVSFVLISCGKNDNDMAFITSGEKANDMVFIKGGEFLMGSCDGDAEERPVHEVYLDDFYIDTYEVTKAQYCEFLNEKGNQEEGGKTWLDIEDDSCRIEKQEGKYVPPSGYENHPVVEVTWYGARAYAEWAGKRLPTEAEWEYAARGGLVGKEYPWGDSISPDLANYDHNMGGTTPVGSYPPNGYGLYDMAGNVSEWCADRSESDYYTNSPYKNPIGPSSGCCYRRVMRGGSWIFPAYDLRTPYRDGHTTNDNLFSIGFRCVR